MGKIRIVTDSTGDLTLEEIESLQIGFLPDIINFDNGSFRELLDLSVAQFYTNMQASENLPTTAQPSPGDMQQLFADLVSQGYEVMAFFISSKLSGTMQTAKLVAGQFPPGSVTVVESCSVCLSLGFMVKMAAKAAAAGRTKQEILQLTDYITENFKFYFVVDSLENLRKGGRIGKASAFLGTMLNIRPLLEIKDGMVCPVEKIRGKGKAIEAMTELVYKDISQYPPGTFRVILGYTGSDEELRKYKAGILQRLGLAETEVSIVAIGAAVGTHAGADALAICYLPWPQEMKALVGE